MANNDDKPGRGAVAIRSKEATKSKEKLKAFIRTAIESFFTEVLNLAEVSIDGKDRYLAFRSKVLTKGNDARRKIHNEIDLFYAVEYIPNKETVIVTKVGEVE